MFHEILFYLAKASKGFEILLRYELCDPKSPLYKKIFAKNPSFKPCENLNPREPALLTTDILTQLGLQVYIPDDRHGSQDAGQHKADIVIPFWVNKTEKEEKYSHIYIQATIKNLNEKDHDKKLRQKAKEFLDSISKFVKDEHAIFVYASLYPFKFGKDLEEKLIILQGDDFSNLKYPIHLLKEDSLRLEDAKEILTKYAENSGNKEIINFVQKICNPGFFFEYNYF